MFDRNPVFIINLILSFYDMITIFDDNATPKHDIKIYNKDPHSTPTTESAFIHQSGN